ncbi:hypothetical protein AB0O57_19475 [Streptomyces sp. NPDC091201]|uniref:hypothetical protein n=1 Tax=Streptomyces sp. NPDC091201 TaxID=3155190 RepID=UPI003441FFB2
MARKVTSGLRGLHDRLAQDHGRGVDGDIDAAEVVLGGGEEPLHLTLPRRQVAASTASAVFCASAAIASEWWWMINAL